MATVVEIIETMKSKFSADNAAGMENIFEFSIEDGDNFFVTINDGDFEITEGESDDPSVTLIMTTEILAGLMNGDVDGMQAFMTGQLKAEGDIMLATKLSELFPV